MREEEGEMKREKLVWGDEPYSSDFFLLTLSVDRAITVNTLVWGLEHFKS